MLGHLFPHRARLVSVGFLLQAAGRRRRRRRLADPAIFENPFAAHHRRSALRMRCQRQNAALPQQALAGFVVNRHAPEPAAINIRDAVVPGQPFVYERVIGGHQIQNAAVFPQDAFKEKLRFAAERLPEIVVEIGENDPCWVGNCAGCATAAIGPRNCSPAPRIADLPACGVPPAPASASSSVCPGQPDRATHRREYCSTERTTGARRVPGR